MNDLGWTTSSLRIATVVFIGSSWTGTALGGRLEVVDVFLLTISILVSKDDFVGQMIDPDADTGVKEKDALCDLVGS